MKITLNQILMFVAVLLTMAWHPSYAMIRGSGDVSNTFFQIDVVDALKEHVTEQQTQPEPIKHESGWMSVKSTAYNSLPSQTDNTPNIAAWGDRLKPGMKAVAVSKDLLERYGFGHNTLVEIQGMPGVYRVLDKMHPRWRLKVDVYHGVDRRAAKVYGIRHIKIRKV